MSTIVTRSGKGSPLTNTEVDANFTNLNTDKAELSGATFTGNLSLGDNVKLQLGNQTDGDLQIYHDGSYSWIKDAGTGSLIVAATNLSLQNAATTKVYANFNDGGSSTIHYDGSPTLATTSSGISVTGSVVADGLTVDGNASVAGTTGVVLDTGTITTGKDSASSRTHWQMNNPNGQVAKWDSNGTDLLHYITDEYKLYTGGNKAFEIDGNGDISFYNDSAAQGLFWDSSASSLGIGVTNVGTKLDIATEANKAGLRVTAPNTTNQSFGATIAAGTSASDYALNVNNAAGSSTLFKVKGDGSSVFSGSVTSTGNITTDYDDTISMDYAPASGAYHKGMSGLNQSSGLGRGLHLFNYDNDSNQGINFWVGTNSSRVHAGKFDGLTGNLNAYNSLMVGSTTAPQAKINVYTDAGRDFRVDHGTANRTILSTDRGMIVKSGGGYSLDLDTGSTSGSIRFLDNGVAHSVFDSSGNLGIGVGTTTSRLKVESSAINLNTAIVKNTAGTGVNYGLEIIAGTNSTDHALHVTSSSGASLLRVNGAGNVNIPNGGLMVGSTTAPEGQLTLQNDDAYLRIRSNTTTTKGLTLRYNHAGNFGQLLVDHQGNNQLDMKYHALSHTFGRSDSQQFMTINSSGNLLVGSSSTPGGSTDGTVIFASGTIASYRTGAAPAVFSRNASNGGEVVVIQQQGTTVGSIGTLSGRMAIGTGNTGLFFDSIRQVLTPHTMTGNTYSTTIDLGRSLIPFKDLYLSGGVYLGGTGAANKLDDVETGTCNMKWSDGTNHSTVIACKYTKVGRLVTVSGYASGNISGLTGTAAVQLAGFPFAFSDYGSFALKTRNINAPTGCISLVGFHGNSGAFANLNFTVDNANYVDVLVSNMSATTNDAYFDVTYQTT